MAKIKTEHKGTGTRGRSGTTRTTGGDGAARQAPAVPGILPCRGAATRPGVVGGRRVVGMGWLPDVPDWRDWTLKTGALVQSLKQRKSKLVGTGARHPRRVDNREHCSPIEDQEQLGSCTAQAVVAMMEYLQRRSRKHHVDGSRLFVYKVTRKLLGLTGDTGAYIRSTIQATAAFGVAPEQHWPYDVARFEDEPEAFLYQYASNYQALQYARLDAPGYTGADTLNDLKRVLATGYVAAFGFPVYSSISNDADIPYPTEMDTLRGGHAILAVGYDDDHQVGGQTVPSLIIRNSWGVHWGEDGYGYLPYDYVRDELTRDFWAIFKEEWIDPRQFG